MTRLRAACFGSIPAILSLAVSAMLGQIRTETRVVLVDTIVTSKQGEYVHDLSAKDFRLWEDNKEQTLKSVTLERSADAASSRQRYIVLFLAGMEAPERMAARSAVSGFIDANARENQLLAVARYNGGLHIGQNFTDNATHLKGAVTAALASDASSGTAASGALDTIRALGNLARNLGSLPGRKTIVFVSGGLSQSSIQRAELTTAIEACNKSDVAVYPIDLRPRSSELKASSAENQIDESNLGIYVVPRGSRGGRGGPQGDSEESDSQVQEIGNSNQQLLFRLANETGGFVVANAGDLRTGLQRIGEEQTEYYLLSYTPSEAKEGSCHTLRVKVDRGGTTVRARSNYCDSKPQDLLAGTIAGQNLERRAAATQTNGLGASGLGASMQLSYFYLSPGVARVNLAMEIPPEAFQKSKGKNAEINFLGIAAIEDKTTADNTVGARFSDAVKLDAENKGKPLHYEKEFKIVPGQYTFTMAFSSGGESFGKLEAPLNIDPREAGKLAMSGIVLSREAHPAAELGLGLGGLTENGTPLVTDGTQIIPTGSHEFTKSEPAFFYFEAYATDPAAVRVGVRVLDRKTAQLKWDSGLMKLSLPKASAGDMVPAGSRLPIATLPAGSYELEITAIDGAGKQVTRTTDFEVK
ncbi:MAG TPA: VWA domain-containing protein [Bryobacteraceae bacterium]|jgi:VWFA-related protein|nr:VWA domain-containing protein [Bryobacteraceae bacterium]